MHEIGLHAFAFAQAPFSSLCLNKHDSDKDGVFPDVKGVPWPAKLAMVMHHVCTHHVSRAHYVTTESSQPSAQTTKCYYRVQAQPW